MTFSCFQRRPYFAKPCVYECFFKGLAKARNELPIHVRGCVVMPEHAHLLVWPVERDFKISRLLGTVKTSVAKRVGDHLGRTNPLALEATASGFHFWQTGSGYDRNLDNDRTI